MPTAAERPWDCRHCGAALTPLERIRADGCDRLACRRRSADERAAAAREAALARRRRAAALAWQRPDVNAAPVVWLKSHATRLVAVGTGERAAHLAHLERLVGLPAPPPAASPSAPDAPAATTLPAAVCAFCAGRCCREGAHSHAFVDRALLQRWVDSRPGSTVADAAGAYAAALPAMHVEGSCLHHGSAGCTLDRSMRSDICNRHACDGLAEARAQVDRGAAGLVAAMAAPASRLRAAWVDADGMRPLPARHPRRG